MDFSNYIFRSHAVGKIINVPKPLTAKQKETLEVYTKRFNGEGKPLTTNQKEDLISLQHKEIQGRKYFLTDGQKKILSELAYAETHKRTVTLNNSKLTKGIEVEKTSRDLLSRVSNILLTSSNDRRTNKWVTGAIDIDPSEAIIDIKSSWSWESFSNITQEKPNEVYLRQLDCYMELWDIPYSLLCHTLVDTPNKLVDGEIRRLDYQNNVLNIEGDVRDENIEEVKQLVSNHIFTRKGIEDFCDYSSIIHIEWFDDFIEIPAKDRVHMIAHSLEKDRIDQRNECISIARKFMNTVKPINNFSLELIK